jgi:hypothetical protein
MSARHGRAVSELLTAVCAVTVAVCAISVKSIEAAAGHSISTALDLGMVNLENTQPGAD